MSKWTYWQYDGSSWRQITSPAIPNPNSQNISADTETNRVAGKLVDGSKYILEPEVLSYQMPITFSYNFQSGALDIENKFNEIHSGGYYFRIISDVPTGSSGDREMWEGKLNKVTVSKVVGWGEQDYKDIVIELEPIKVS